MTAGRPEAVLVPAAGGAVPAQGFYVAHVKYRLDRVLALAVLAAVSPLLLVLLPCLAVSLRGNPFFTQARGGYRNRVFQVIKLRTMTSRSDAAGNLLPDHERLTRVGRLVRRSSLDELPQLINVLKGEMSFIGPRPFLAEYLTIYTPEERRRHDVKPGITGLAQVNGRNALTWKEKFRLDVRYVEEASFLLDLRILFSTIVKILRGADVDPGGEVTMEKYNGSN